MSEDKIDTIAIVILVILCLAATLTIGAAQDGKPTPPPRCEPRMIGQLFQVGTTCDR